MKLVIHPPVEAERFDRVTAAAGPMAVVNAADEADALHHLPDADAFFGKLTPRLLAAAPRLRWVQAPMASLEHYLFPELAAHPCALTNMRGLFSDVIADQVMGYVLCFARNLHVYVLQAAAGKWAPVGGEAARVAFTSGPGTVNDIDRAHRHLGGATLGVVGLGAIGREVARRAAAFGMRVVAVDPRPADVPPEVAAVWPVEQLPRLLAESEYVVVAAPHTPRSAGCSAGRSSDRCGATRCSSTSAAARSSCSTTWQRRWRRANWRARRWTYSRPNRCHQPTRCGGCRAASSSPRTSPGIRRSSPAATSTCSSTTSAGSCGASRCATSWTRTSGTDY
ncbi:MAG TPA: NAD(P)-dependent oxidoreductase [Urbifossiella sp.]|nr:NAD(P)-dependent oxidoreductase [Urbifossiella sp.]